MRVMLKVKLATEAGNLACADGSIARIFGEVFTTCPPEATYFLVENGHRTVYAILDLKTPDQVPQIAEPLFQGLNAGVDIHPIMAQSELEAGLMGWGAKHR